MRVNHLVSTCIVSLVCLLGLGVAGSSLCLANDQVSANCKVNITKDTISLQVQLDHVNHRYFNFIAYENANYYSNKFVIFPAVDLSIGKYIAHGRVINNIKPVSHVVQDSDDGTYSGSVSIFFPQATYRPGQMFRYVIIYLHDSIPNDSHPSGIPITAVVCKTEM